jgi:phage shock protein A
MTEVMEQEPTMDLNGMLLFSEQESHMMEKLERIERKIERLERTLTKLGKVVIRHVTEAKEE